ncbi:hypothetical protein QBC38DRAFT_26272 [Podospora fimiseda]|uniref:Uncharacterized protein n=1 Tax=Podospora fimiseda TaxID=252190 RepID=A0AAN7BIR2_9PEZI|nr:hypothetical protein QBC38DRAFT_26272 [Podospora fimiseda]
MARFTLKNPFHFFFPSDTNELTRKPSPPSRRFSIFRPSSQNSNSSRMHKSDINNQDALASPPLSSPESAIDSTFSSPALGLGSPDSGLSGSYFPDADKHLSPHPCPTCKRSPSMSSSVSSDASSTTSEIMSRPTLAPRTSTSNLTPLPTPTPVPGRVRHTVDPLSREFPKPTHEPTLDELLARKPGKWSLNHYVKNAKDISLQNEQLNIEARRREMEEAKRRLLEMAGR